MPEVSVVVPTRNRAAFLGACLASLCAQTLAPARYDICVVNNDGSDNTPEIVAQTAAKFPQHKIFMVHEKVIGLSISRNTGIRETSSPLVAMSDDDATMPPDWLERFLARFASLGPQVAKVGGEIVPVWAAPRPLWLTDSMLPMLSATTGFKQEPHFSDAPLMEGNSCFRRDAILQAGGFPAQLGRSGAMLLSGDQIVDMIMFLKGWKLFFDPAIVIHHTIHADRLTPEWLRKRYFWQGVSDYVARMYLKDKGVTITHALSLELPLDMADWAFINDKALMPTEEHFMKFHSLGLVLAMSGMIPIQGGGMSDPLAIGRSAEVPFTITDEDMQLFAKLSGDENPLHFDKAAAVKAGYDKPIVYGGLLVAKISQLLGMWLPGPGSIWARIDLAFEKPLHVGEPAVLKGAIANISPAVHLVQINHAVTRGSDVIARGSSDVKFHMPETS